MSETQVGTSQPCAVADTPPSDVLCPAASQDTNQVPVLNLVEKVDEKQHTADYRPITPDQQGMISSSSSVSSSSSPATPRETSLNTSGTNV